MNQDNKIEVLDDFVDREYQRNIIDVCVERNSIVYLPTGAGKTHIAVKVIEHFSDQLKKKYTDDGKRSFFLVNTVALAKQQGDHMKRILPFNICVLTGENGVDGFYEEKWTELLNQNEIFVMTAQCFADAVAHTYIRLESANVIVFDECHWARKGHVYRQIMQSFEVCGNANNIRVIGLSGMLIGNDKSTKPHTVNDELRQLESCLQSTIITVNNINDRKNVLIYSTKAKEHCVKFRPTKANECLLNVIRGLLDLEEYLKPIKLNKQSNTNPKTLLETGPTKIKDLINLLKDFSYQVEHMGTFGSYLSLMNILIQLELSKRVADSEKFRNIVKICITKVEYWIGCLKRDFGLDRKNAQTVLENSSEKVQKLLCLLKMFFFDDPNRPNNMQCLIFTERRSTAKILYHIIKCFGNEEENFQIKPDFVVGRNSSMQESIESILNESNNSMALEKFRNKETNCIVCTNVLEEGIDLQACNLVVVYDPPKTPRSYVQSRGRARDDNSNYVIMLDEVSIEKFKSKFHVWQNIDEAMKKALIGKTIDRLPPNPEDIRNEQAQVWEPFYTNENACLTALNCIPILNMYAQTLPADRFTNVNIHWKRIDHEDETFSVNLTLPIQSMIRDETIGEKKTSLKLAKQDAAFKACINLYHNGNLTEQLTPVDNKIRVEQYNNTYFDHWEKYKDDDAKKAGTKNNRRIHKIKTPCTILNCGPGIGTNFLYRITIKPKFDTENNVALEAFHKLLSNGNTFGILTKKRIPKLCAITLFQSYGEIECVISELPVAVELENVTKLQKLRQFHINIFRDILKTFKNWFVLDKSSYLIVPIDEYNELDWQIINKFQAIPEPKQLTKGEIQNMTFESDDYLYNVINPVYREYTDQNYVVINVAKEKNPMSPFPNKNTSQTYADYYKDKYKLKIHRQDQFLIEVKGISKNLKLFFPGCGITGKQRKYERINECEEYIPEICHNYKFPGDYWLKATLLPSICHRIFYMLIAEELRRRLIDDGIDMDNGQQIYKLDVDYGDYEKREEISKRYECPSPQILDDFQKVLKEYKHKESDSSNSSKNIRTRANLLWQQGKLPVDLDRNWLNITEVDIDYYCAFTSGNNKSEDLPVKVTYPNSLARPKQCVASIQDREICKVINLLSKNKLSSSVQQKDLMKVITTANAGDVFDMERFETLGDAFLKFITSLFLYKSHDNFHEGYLTALKGKIVSNRNLFYIGNDFGLSGMLKANQFCQYSSFAPSTTLPLNLKPILEENEQFLAKMLDLNLTLTDDEIQNGCIQNNLDLFNANFQMNDNDNVDKSLIWYMNEHFIGDKIVADAVEALIGCVISSLGPDSALKLCTKLKILPNAENIENLLKSSIAPRVIYENDLTLINQSLLEKKINYKFKNRIYLTQALTHASYPNKSSGTYQQLEFLGDAVLDFLITSYISEQCPKMSPGKLTDLRSALVNNVTLACIVVRNGIEKHMLYENHLLAEAIKNFIDFQESNKHEITDQIILLNTESDTPIAKSIEVPKALGDIFESIIGAVFLDTNLSLEKTWDVIYELMKSEIHKFKADVPLQIIRRLFEFQGGHAEPKFYKTEMIQGDENVAVPLTIKNQHGDEEIFIGFGKNRKMAKEAAAKKALLHLMS